jgi:hypothetical protein
MTMGVGSVVNSLVAVMAGAGLWDEDRSGLHRGNCNWHPRRRGEEVIGSYPFFKLWSSSGFSQDLASCGTDWNQSGAYEEMDSGYAGKRGDYFIKGQVLDENAVAQTGVSVKAFRSSDNQYAGSATSDSNGYYMVPTPYPGVAHFIVAYLDTAEDLVGTTVNNLMPTAS